MGLERPDPLGVLADAAVTAEEPAVHGVDDRGLTPACRIAPGLIYSVLSSAVIGRVGNHQKGIALAEIFKQWAKKLAITLAEMSAAD